MPTLPVPNLWELPPTPVHFPIALPLTAVAADLLGRGRETVRRAAAGLLVLVAISGWVAAAAGLLAFLTVPAGTEAAHALMYWHLSTALTALVPFTGLAATRRRRRAEPSGGATLATEAFAAALLTFAGYLGGVSV